MFVCVFMVWMGSIERGACVCYGSHIHMYRWVWGRLSGACVYVYVGGQNDNDDYNKTYRSSTASLASREVTFTCGCLLHCIVIM